MAEKITRRDNFVELQEYVAENEKLAAFVQSEIDKIDARNEKEKEKRAKKRAQGDELQAAVKAFIQDHEGAVTAQVIADEIGGEDVTKAKVTYRATQLVKAGEIFKVTVKTEDGRKAVAYTAEAPAEDAEANAE